MFSAHSKKSYSAFIFFMLFFIVGGLTACDSQPPKLMKAVKQFSSEKGLEDHLSHIRKDHMDLLKHKRDETMIRGIRTKENSLKACINCHVPETHNGKVLRSSDPEHFCATCHNYVAADLDCFQCHVDHPVKENDTAKVDNPHKKLTELSQADNNVVKLAEEKSKVVSGEASNE